MRRLALTLLLVAIATPVFAYDTPKALLRALYAPYSKGDSFDWSKWDEAKFRSKALNALFAADEKEANGDIGRLDFDPYVDGQDYQITGLRIGVAKIDGATATVEVTFKNFDNPDDMTFTLVKEADGWKVDDVASSGTEYPYSLRAIMEAPMPSEDDND